jgi:anti-sigma factor RsiW
VIRWITCREFVDFLDDYLSGSLSEEERAALNGHLAVCPSCVAYMKTYQASVQLGKAVLTRSEEPVPEEVPEELVRAILAARKQM